MATFIITAVFVGYTASQEPSKEIAEGHEISLELETLNNHVIQTTHKANLSKNNHSF